MSKSAIDMLQEHGNAIAQAELTVEAVQTYIKHHGEDFTRIMLRNLQCSRLDDISPLGYVINGDYFTKIIEVTFNGGYYTDEGVIMFTEHGWDIHHGETVLWFMPEPAPDFLSFEIGEHVHTAAALMAILPAHGIDPQDFNAVLDYLLDGSGLKYMVKVYVDYVYNSAIQALSDELQTVYMSAPAWGFEGRMVQSLGRAQRVQRTTHTNKPNRKPRGKCARKMEALGWKQNG